MRKGLKIFLVSVLEILLFAPAMFEQKIDRGLRSVDEYWAETGLQPSELENLLAEDICSADKISYLSCVNSISQMADKLGLLLLPDGTLQDLSRQSSLLRETEKVELASWAEEYDKAQVIPGAKFLSLWEGLRSKVSQKNQAALIALGINAYLSIAHDPHSYIIPLQFYEEAIAKSDSKIVNLGFIARRSKTAAVVRKLFVGSPAEAAGLRKGDHILRVNGIEVSSMLNSQFAEILKVRDSDRLALLVSRTVNGKQVTKYLEIIKQDFSIPSVEISVREGSKNLGILTIHKFAKETCQQTENALRQLMGQSIAGLLLDLRDNPGGQVEEAACILNLFIDKNRLIFETHYLDPLTPIDRYVTSREPIYRGPLAVLINSGSASASEIVAGALKDHKRATLVGERTFGKGSFQDGKIWGAYQKIAVFETEGMYYFPSGWTPQLVGIEPDLHVKFANTDFQREEDLFFRPLRPKDLWVGPQTISWLQLMQCPESSTLWQDLGFETEDAQMLKAFEWLNCRTSKVGSYE